MVVLQLFLFLVGPCAIALWADHRFSGRRPSDLITLGFMVATAMLLCATLGPLTGWIVGATSRGLGIELIVAVTCVVLAYAFLSGLWLVRLGVEAMSSLGGR
jgi:hypothetical protein